MQPTLEKPTQQTTNPINELPPSMSNLGEAFAAGPPAQPPSPELPIQPSKKSRKKWIILIVLFLLIACSIIPIIVVLNSKEETKSDSKVVAPVAKTTNAKTPYLFIADYQQKKVFLADATGKQVYGTSLELTPSFVDASPDKQILASTYNNQTQVTTYLLLDKNGKSQPINQTAQKLMQDKTTINRTFSLLNDSIVVSALCSPGTNKDNQCKLLQINLLSGDQKTLLETSAPVPFATGESTFDIINASEDHKTIYLNVAGPTKLGDDQQAIYSLDTVTNKSALVYAFAKDRNVNNPTLSGDNKKLVYDVQGGSGGSTEDHTIIYSVDLSTKKENSADWTKSIISGGMPFVWAPDNNKFSFVGFKTVTGQVSSIGPLTLGYLNFSQNKITDLQTIEDSSKQDIRRLYWLDNSTLLYGINTSTAYHDFSNSTGQVYKQDLNAKTGTKVSAPAGTLEQLLLW